jgi:hypothetical protein
MQLIVHDAWAPHCPFGGNHALLTKALAQSSQGVELEEAFAQAEWLFDPPPLIRMKLFQRTPKLPDPSLGLVTRTESATNLLDCPVFGPSGDYADQELDRNLRRLIRSTKKLIVEHGLLVADCKSIVVGEGGAGLRLEVRLDRASWIW